MHRLSRQGDGTSPVRPARRTLNPRLSRTTPATIPSDVAFWPAWTKMPVDQLDLDQFDESGNARFAQERGV